MINAIMKLVVWLLVGGGIIVGAAQITDIQASSPWAYTVHSTAAGVGSLTVTGPEVEGEATTPVKLTTGATPQAAEVEQRFDVGLMAFLAVLYTGGTIMGMLLKPRRRGNFTVADQNCY